jgi:hypothetical protein
LSALNLDVNTLFLVTIYVEAILGLLLLFAWVQNTAITAVAWWGFAHLLRALRDAFDCVVIIIHHCGYDETHIAAMTRPTPAATRPSPAPLMPSSRSSARACSSPSKT